MCGKFTAQMTWREYVNLAGLGTDGGSGGPDLMDPERLLGGGGTNFSATGPAITLPLANAGGGRRTQLRVYVFVYASMSGTTNTGSIGVANKSSSGTMATSATALTNAATISGSTFAWYPTLSTWTPGTGQYFSGYTGSAFDRIGLCSGATDTIRIGAWTMIVAPATS